ncbi:MAG TPA: GNAT family protein [Longimicrobiaceae bacterium]|nr:GNAT family protein [Longimicrobiaceae bacterium]
MPPGIASESILQQRTGDGAPAGPAYRVHTPRLVLRCWDPVDAPLLQEAVEANVAHLRPWMPWAGEEPKGLDARVEDLRRFRGHFDLGIDFTYAVLDRDEARVLGGTGLHLRAGERLEIGYWIHVDHVGRGLATEAAAALTRVAFEVERVGRVEIRCDPRNVRSAAVPARLGYRHEATLRGDALAPDGSPRDTQVWGLLADEYRASPACAAPIEAFDAAGRRIL